MTGVEYSAMNAICDIAKIKKNDPDYWTRLEYTYAGMFMKSFLDKYDGSVGIEDIINSAIKLAHALVQKLKEKEERK